MLEDQALDRVYRIGQTKEVTTTRYIVKGTLEEVGVIGISTIVIVEANFFEEHPSSAVEKAGLG